MDDKIQKNNTVEFQQYDINDKVKITRDKHTKSAFLHIDIKSDWSLFSGNSVHEIDLEEPIAKGTNTGIFPLLTNSPERKYFKLITNENIFLLSENHLPMEGAYNFRDLGGIKTIDGRRTKWGKLFRADDLSKLTQKDLDYLSSIPIHTIIDFRSQKECEVEPDKIPNYTKNYFNLDIVPGSLIEYAQSKIQTKEDVINAMNMLYKYFITDITCINVYKKFFEIIQKDDNLPLLFHCAAGKDRTGFAAAMILLALNIPKSTIMEDYMNSNILLGNKYEAIFQKNPLAKYMYTCLPEYLENCLIEIKKIYNNTDYFLSKILEIDLDSFREKFLY